VNTLVLRTEVNGDLRVRELLQRVREVCLGAYAHQEVPFEMLVEQLQPERDMSHTPLFQVMLNLLNVSANAGSADGVPVTGDELSVGSLASGEGLASKFDLSLSAQEQNEQLYLWLTYNAELFDESTVRRILGHFQNVFESLVSEPEQRLSELALTSDAERHQMLVEWNETEHEYPREQSVVELFERQVERTPEASALWFSEAELSYAELDRRANQLAHYLQRLGAGPEAKVGIVLERSLELVAAVLGVLKAGAAYVPVEPQQPAARLQQLLTDADVSVVLTHSSLRSQLGQLQTSIVCVDEQWEQFSHERTSAPPRPGDDSQRAEQLLYVMYTSGSTGQPKGVMIQQGGVSNYLAWMQAQYPLGIGDRLLQTTSIGFDVSVRELFWPLLSGAQVVLPRPGEQQDSGRLVELIVNEQITQARFVPAMLQLFLAEERVSECRSLQRVFCGGEALPRALQERFHERLPWVELHNTYGPT